ncbi:MAG TPA: hypothetical protein VFB14_01520 [Bryobacteraceae bacterium]|jgi:hypothetical protein|nr:hypothetical protein [Bryobacteraceae bacterium]
MPDRKIERQLEALKEIRALGPTQETESALRKALCHRVNVVAARAATIAAELQLKAVMPDLLAAFDRLFENAVHSLTLQ